jgi:hypothetical protein
VRRKILLEDSIIMAAKKKKKHTPKPAKKAHVARPAEVFRLQEGDPADALSLTFDSISQTIVFSAGFSQSCSGGGPIVGPPPRTPSRPYAVAGVVIFDSNDAMQGSLHFVDMTE